MCVCVWGGGGGAVPFVSCCWWYFCLFCNFMVEQWLYKTCRHCLLSSPWSGHLLKYCKGTWANQRQSKQTVNYSVCNCNTLKRAGAIKHNLGSWFLKLVILNRLGKAFFHIKPLLHYNTLTARSLYIWRYFDIHWHMLVYTPQNNWRTNAINYNIVAFYVERILKTNFKI